MFGRLATLFHKESRDLFEDNVFIPSDTSRWPESWITISFKEYPRMPRIPLPDPTLLTTELSAAFSKRASNRALHLNRPLSQVELSTLLYYSAGIRNRPNGAETEGTWDEAKRFYPSGGARYPLEVYMAIRNVEHLEKGIYHYHVKEHALEKLLGYAGMNEIGQTFRADWTHNAQVLFLITSVWSRNFIKYQDFGYRIVCMEAGHLLQNALLAGTSLGLTHTPLVGFQNEKVDEILDIADRGESSLYAATFGK